jgi:DNA repair protein RadC
MKVQEVKMQMVREVECAEAVEAPKMALAVWRALVETASWYDPDKEAFVALLLNTKNKVVAAHLITLGTLDASLVHAREVFRPAIVAAAKAVLLMHNHPSGDQEPSVQDIRATREMAAAGRMLDIAVLDHVIVASDAPGGYYSLREHCPEVFA